MPKRGYSEPKWYSRELEPYAELYNKYREKALPMINDLLNKLPPKDIARLVKAAKACDLTNCWWCTYEVAKIILNRYA